MFALKQLEEIKGKLNFYVLIKDGVNQYAEIKLQLEKEGSYDSELVTLQARLQEMAELRLMPEKKCRQLYPKENKEYELKTKNLRLYVFHLENMGRVIVFLGKKTHQTKDIKKFRSLKKQYLDSL